VELGKSDESHILKEKGRIKMSEKKVLREGEKRRIQKIVCIGTALIYLVVPTAAVIGGVNITVALIGVIASWLGGLFIGLKVKGASK